MDKIRKQLSEYSKKLVDKGLVSGPGGNISGRCGDEVFLSPSGFFLEEIREQDWIKVNIKTGEITGDLRPTCEMSMHLGIYAARNEIKAVIHAHPTVTVGLISSGAEFRPVFPDYVAVLGRNVPVLEYVTPGGEKIRKAVVAEINNSNVVLMKNHGAVCVGETLKEAFARALIVEDAAKAIFVGTVAGKMKYLDIEEIEAIENMEAEDYRKALLRSDKA